MFRSQFCAPVSNFTLHTTSQKASQESLGDSRQENGEIQPVGKYHVTWWRGTLNPPRFFSLFVVFAVFLWILIVFFHHWSTIFGEWFYFVLMTVIKQNLSWRVSICAFFFVCFWVVKFCGHKFLPDDWIPGTNFRSLAPRSSSTTESPPGHPVIPFEDRYLNPQNICWGERLLGVPYSPGMTGVFLDV